MFPDIPASVRLFLFQSMPDLPFRLPRRISQIGLTQNVNRFNAVRRQSDIANHRIPLGLRQASCILLAVLHERTSTYNSLSWADAVRIRFKRDL